MVLDGNSMKSDNKWGRPEQTAFSQVGPRFERRHDTLANQFAKTKINGAQRPMRMAA